MSAAHLMKSRQAAKRYVAQWDLLYPKTVRYLREGLEELLTFFYFKDRSW
jgi:hypothetical protein